jgi:hypothetical protein
MIDYDVRRIDTKTAKAYIVEHHYSHGCHNGPSPCYGLFDKESLTGVLMFATPCSENVRASVFGIENKGHVIELHRLHILDVTPKNAESYFISRCLKLLKKDRPDIWGVLSFSDPTEGHTGTIYQATNAFFVGTSSPATFYRDKDGRLRHPRQNGVNITKSMALEKGWATTKRQGKLRYLWILGNSHKQHKANVSLCKYRLDAPYLGQGGKDDCTSASHED